MSTVSIPVLLLEDHSGNFFALTVEAQPVSAAGRSVQAALKDLRELLLDQVEKPPQSLLLLLAEISGSDRFVTGGLPLDGIPRFIDPKLTEFVVPVHTEYKAGKKVFASHRPVTIRATTVWGATEDGYNEAVIPLLGIDFTYGEDDALKPLVLHYVQNELKGRTAGELLRFFPPKEASLESLSLRLPAESHRHQKSRWSPPALSSVADSFLDLAGSASTRAYERTREVDLTLEKLRDGRGSLLLVGKRGTGKTTVLLEAVRGLPKTRTEEGERELNAEYCWQTSGGRLVSGMKYLGQWQERLEEIISELASEAGLLAVDDLLTLVKLGGSGPTDSLAAFLIPYLLTGELRLVAETTPQELEACRRLLPAFPAVFEILRIPELSERPALAVLDRVAENRLKHAKKSVEKGATDLIYRLFHRFLPYEGFPGKAIAFLRDLCDEVVKASAPEVTKERALEMFVRRTGLPEVFLRDELPLPLEGVKQSLEKDVRGQPAAIDAVARTVTAFKAGLADPRKPLGVLLFAGPTGVGKTALARALSRYCFGQGEKQDRLVRLDMSEYGGPGAVQSFLGEGSEDVPAWIRRVREQPFCVLLFDEIEKASDLVFDVLLSLLDEGRLTDKLGRLTHFTSAFVVMTTNLGATARSAPGFGETAAPSYEQEAMKFFRPEFFNRIDRVVTFHSLSRETVLDITRKELAELALREGFVRSGLELVWTESVVEWLAKVGFDALLGARPLQRAIETKVVTPLSLLLAANPKTQNTTVRLDFTQGSGLSTTIGRK